ncbi:MAG: PadR family transcriptional regulator [Clostridia bacterium]
MDIQLKRGILDVCVLTSLLKGESYGYKIIKDVSPIVEISESTLYPILKRLEQANCVLSNKVEHNGRLRKYYEITPLGQQKITDFILEWEEIMKIYCYIKENKNDD